MNGVPMKLKIYIYMILVIFLTGCGGLRVETDYDKDYDYALLKTYNWADIDKTEHDNVLTVMPDVYERARAAVNKTLNAKGYRLASNNEHDFLVDIYLGIEEIKDIIDNRSGGRGSRGGVLDIQNNVVREGTIIVDIITPDDTYVIWRGIGMDKISEPDPNETKEIKQRRADHIIYQLLEQFPPDLD
jgi:hypothetical protein